MFGSMKSKPREDRELVGFYTHTVIWADLNNLEERVIMNFYRTNPSGVRSVEIDYEGTLVRNYKKGNDLNHLRRLWIDANTLPPNTKFVGKYKRLMEGKR